MLKKYQQFTEALDTENDVSLTNQRNIDKEQDVFSSRHAGSMVLLNMPFIRKNAESPNGYEIKYANDKTFNTFWRPDFDEWVPLNYVTLCRYLLYRWLYRYGNPKDDRFGIDIEQRIQALVDGEKLRKSDKYIQSFEVNAKGEPEVTFKFKALTFGEFIFIRDSLIRGKYDMSVRVFTQIPTNHLFFNNYVKPLVPFEPKGRIDDETNINFLNKLYLNSTKIFNTRKLIKAYDVIHSLTSNATEVEFDCIRLLQIFLGEKFDETSSFEDKYGIDLKSKKGTKVQVKKLSHPSFITISKIAPYKVSVLRTLLNIGPEDHKKYDYIVFYNTNTDKVYLLNTKSIKKVDVSENSVIYTLNDNIDDRSKLNDNLFIMNIKEGDDEPDEEGTSSE